MTNNTVTLFFYCYLVILEISDTYTHQLIESIVIIDFLKLNDSKRRLEMLSILFLIHISVLKDVFCLNDLIDCPLKIIFCLKQQNILNIEFR